MPNRSPENSADKMNGEEGNEENLCEYYLIRVPKSINVKELNGTRIDLEAFGSSQSAIVSKSTPGKSYSFDLIPHKGNSSSNMTILTTTEGETVQMDTNYSLKGFVNFYLHKSQSNPELRPLVPTCPNDSISDIVNRARGHSGKRKSVRTLKKGEKSQQKKRSKVP